VADRKAIQRQDGAYLHLRAIIKCAALWEEKDAGVEII
jgi:hypothetical protein